MISLKIYKPLTTIVICCTLLLIFLTNTTKGFDYLSRDSTISEISINNTDTLSFYKDVKIRRALKLVTENLGNPRFVILDVRGVEEYSEGHIPNAINIDYKSSVFKIRIDSLDKGKIYLVYCVAGYRSKKSMNMMIEDGFKRIYNMKGGMMKWKAKGFPIEEGKK